MSRLIKADLFRMIKSKLTLVLFILAVTFPVFNALMYVLLRGLFGVATPLADTVGLFSANTLIGSSFQLSDNLGIVIPLLAGALVCTDFTSGTLRNKIIAGNDRVRIYFSHLIVSILFSLGLIYIYTLSTVGFSLLMLPYKADFSSNVLQEYVFWAVNGTMSFVFISTVSTFFAMTFRSIAPTILSTLGVIFLLVILTGAIMMADYSNLRPFVYLIPTFSGNFFSLTGQASLASVGLALYGVANDSKEVIFTYGMLSFGGFSVINTALGLILFCKRDLK